MTPEQLRREREALGLTQLELAILLQVYPITVSRWERGINPISNVVALAMRQIKSQRGQLTKT